MACWKTWMGCWRRSETGGFSQALLKKDGWVLEDTALIRLFERLMKHGTAAGRVRAKGRIYYGINYRSKRGVRHQARPSATS